MSKRISLCSSTRSIRSSLVGASPPKRKGVSSIQACTSEPFRSCLDFIITSFNNENIEIRKLAFWISLIASKINVVLNTRFSQRGRPWPLGETFSNITWLHYTLTVIVSFHTY